MQSSASSHFPCLRFTYAENSTASGRLAEDRALSGKFERLLEIPQNLVAIHPLREIGLPQIRLQTLRTFERLFRLRRPLRRRIEFSVL